MAEQVQKERTSTERTTDEAESVKGLSAERQAEVDKKKADLDDLMDDIDELLGTEVEELAVNYVQKGGQ